MNTPATQVIAQPRHQSLLAVWTVCIALAAFLAFLALRVADGNDPLPPAGAGGDAPLVVVVTANVVLPTETPTTTPTATATARPTRAPTPTTVPCDTPVPNTVCQWTVPRTPSVTTATPIPVCRVVERIDGLRCRWPTAVPIPTVPPTATPQPAPTSAPLPATEPALSKEE